VVFPGHIQFPFRARDDSDSWTGKCDSFDHNQRRSTSLGIDPSPSGFVSCHCSQVDHNHPHHAFRRPDQRPARVSCRFGLFSLIWNTYVCFRYLPVMISRLTISLRKTADTRRTGWTSVDPLPDGGGNQTVIFFHAQRGTNSRTDDILLDTLSRP